MHTICINEELPFGLQHNIRVVSLNVDMPTLPASSNAQRVWEVGDLIITLIESTERIKSLPSEEDVVRTRSMGLCFLLGCQTG